MKIIRESLNKLDLIGIDNNNYYDLRNLYEAVEPRMTPQDKQELRKLIDVTDNPETISATKELCILSLSFELLFLKFSNSANILLYLSSSSS